MSSSRRRGRVAASDRPANFTRGKNGLPPGEFLQHIRFLPRRPKFKFRIASMVDGEMHTPAVGRTLNVIHTLIVSPIQRLGDAQYCGEIFHHVAFIRRQRHVRFVAFFGHAPSVVAGGDRHDVNFLRRKAR